MRILPAVLGLLLGSSVAVGGLAATAQRLPTPAVAAAIGAFSGIVVDADTGQPLAGALLRLERPEGQSGEVTDAKGRFVFDDLVPYDHYGLSATRSGYRDLVPAGPNAAAGDGRLPPVSVAAGQWVRDFRVAMRRSGAISGLVQDDRGSPIIGAYVRVLVEALVAGERRLVLGPVARTDDRGAYRIAGLAQGTYYVQMPSVQEAVAATTTTAELAGSPSLAQGTSSDRRHVTPFGGQMAQADALNQLVIGRYPIPPQGPDGHLLVYPMTFFPAGADLENATPIGLAGGEDQGGVDLQVTAVPGARVTGTLNGPPQAYAGLTVRLIMAGAHGLGIGGEVATALVGPGGRFTFVNVPAGSYLIEARSWRCPGSC